jgi:hypothetical protein
VSNRLKWSGTPVAVRDWVERQLGAAVVAVVDEVGGFSPGPACRVRTANGRRAFVKAVGASINPQSPDMHRREGRITAQLPSSAYLPKLLATYDDGDWVALLYTEIDGRQPQLPWDHDELRRVLDATALMHDALTPCPVTSVETVAELLDDDLRGWRALASGGDATDTLDEWSRRNLDRLAALEGRWPDAAAGDTLLHADMRADNVLVGPDGVVFVDWAHGCRGAPVFDVVAWAPSVAMQGGPAPEALLALHPRSRSVDDDAVTAIVAAIAGYFTRAAMQPPAPGIPTLRSFQGAQGEVARAWLLTRTGLP